MKLGKVAVAAGILVLLLGVTPVFADSPHSNVSLSLNGAILSAGTSSYSHQGGQLVAGSILGQQVNPKTSVLHYSLQAQISGVSVSGVATFSLVALGAGGSHTEVDGNAVIGGMIPAETFPLGCTFGVDCTSAIPGVFLGLASATVFNCAPQQGHDDGSDGESNCTVVAQLSDMPMSFESAFLNPFGGPIFMASDGGEIYVIATYTASRVSWTGIQLGGTATGSLAGSPVTGLFAMNVSAVEDLRGGYELDHGTIAFAGMSNPSLDAFGTFVGKSTIPAGTACPPELGFPPGTCQLTGFSSAGVFAMSTALGGSLKGGYSTAWIVPAVAFTSTVTATLK